jgi:hypothetical protein
MLICQQARDIAIADEEVGHFIASPANQHAQDPQRGSRLGTAPGVETWTSIRGSDAVLSWLQVAPGCIFFASAAASGNKARAKLKRGPPLT